MMARKVVPLREGDGEGDGDDNKKTVTAISERNFDLLHKKVRTAEAGMKSEQGTIGQLISDAVADKHLHKGAYGIFRRLDKMDDYKRAELLFHLDLYRERAKWDESDLFERGAEAAE
jgi:hypothetical protein